MNQAYVLRYVVPVVVVPAPSHNTTTVFCSSSA
jgi:hypothetical protein